jgi:serine/threonine-protein kinase RsbT
MMERVDLFTEIDIFIARQKGVEAARAMGFSIVDQTRIALCISELARNVIQYAEAGYMELRKVCSELAGEGLEIRFEDYGPGIPDPELAVIAGFSTSGGLGIGLAGTKQMMDEFALNNLDGKGASVIVRKWLPDGNDK